MAVAVCVVRITQNEVGLDPKTCPLPTVAQGLGTERQSPSHDTGGSEGLGRGNTELTAPMAPLAPKTRD
jgi:hypothetical protein